MRSHKTLGVVLATALLSALTTTPVSAQNAVGDWLGVVSVSPGLVFPVAVHIHKALHGGYSGTLDSPGRGSYDLVLSNIVLGPSALSFDVSALSGRYSARWDAATFSWIGQWSQASQPPRALNLAPGLAQPAPSVSGLDGDWDGTLEAAPGVKLRLAFHVKTGVHGTLASVDSIDQGANGVPISSISLDGTAVGFDLKRIGASFQGELASSGQTINGRWIQQTLSTPLVLTRRGNGQSEATLIRPQTPMKPYPYQDEEVTFDDASAHVKLAGTLTLPRGRDRSRRWSWSLAQGRTREMSLSSGTRCSWSLPII